MPTTYTWRTSPTTTWTGRTQIARSWSYLCDVSWNIINDVNGNPFVVYDSTWTLIIGTPYNWRTSPTTTYTGRIIP